MPEHSVQSKAKFSSHFSSPLFIHILSWMPPPHTIFFHGHTILRLFLTWRICCFLLSWLHGHTTYTQQCDSLSLKLLVALCCEFSLCLIFEYALKSRDGLWLERMACQEGSVSHVAFLNHVKSLLVAWPSFLIQFNWMYKVMGIGD